jgi:hypothetical protein
MRLLSATGMAVVCAALLSGCGGDGRYNFKGRVVKGGAPYTVPDGDTVRLTFYPVTDDGKNPKNTYIAQYDNKNGTFKAYGPDGKGIPPGKYLIGLEHLSKRKDLFGGAYDGDHSQFVFDFGDKSKEIVIDLDSVKPPERSASAASSQLAAPDERRERDRDR